ncbi:MAG: S-methyl-5-thioribose-1-phosphate isomerase [candidate division WOR-3 bacterium]|nr:S-methyl-5-thioribose-1-phosphate isomerase [candidate division WOR-3 bacterium]
MLDQRKLPFEEVYIEVENAIKMASLIRDMAIRGAPLIAIASAYAILIEVLNNKEKEETIKSVEILKSTRPTAVNLFNVLSEIEKILLLSKNYKEELYNFVIELDNREKEMNLKIAKNGIEVFKKKSNVLTYCNTGFLATTGIGTALGIIYMAYEKGLVKEVIVPETRPYLQGSRLTVYELEKLKIPYKLITDNSIAFLMSKGYIDLVIVGADRVLKDGTLINKIGTLNIAILSNYFNIPFYTAFPSSTMDNFSKIEDIKIEIRGKDEVIKIKDVNITIDSVDVLNYAFDITPKSLITGYITDEGVFFTMQ